MKCKCLLIVFKLFFFVFILLYGFHNWRQVKMPLLAWIVQRAITHVRLTVIGSVLVILQYNGHLLVKHYVHNQWSVVSSVVTGGTIIITPCRSQSQVIAWTKVHAINLAIIMMSIMACCNSGRVWDDNCCTSNHS